MRVFVNGEPRELHEGTTVEALLRLLAATPNGCASDPANASSLPAGAPTAVEINRTLVRRRDHAARVLAENDRVEIVTLVGGG